MTLEEKLRKSDRLLKRPEFLRVQTRGRKASSKSFIAVFLKNSQGKNRLGIAVSRKFGKSVQRNRFKRLIREVFRKNRALFPESCDVVVIPKLVDQEPTYRSLVEELSRLHWKAR